MANNNEMKTVEAERLAQKIYGATAHAEVNSKTFLLENFMGKPAATWQGWPPRLSLGWGWTWEEAFALAKKRSRSALSKRMIERYREE